jgi:hypothetical protein
MQRTLQEGQRINLDGEELIVESTCTIEVSPPPPPPTPTPPPPPPDPGEITNLVIGLSDDGNEARYKASFTHPANGAATGFQFQRTNDCVPLSPVAGPERINGGDAVEARFLVSDLQPGDIFSVRTLGGTAPDGQTIPEGPWIDITVP